MIGDNREQVSAYLNDIALSTNNKSINVQKRVSDYGELVLSVSLPLSQEDKLKCLNIWAKFYRNNDGIEICVNQIVAGTDVSAYDNIEYVKDNFKSVSNNMWIKKISDDLVIDCELEKTKNVYSLIYSLRQIK